MGQISQLIIAATSGHGAFNCQPSQASDTTSHVHQEEEKRLVLQYFTNTKANSHNFVFFCTPYLLHSDCNKLSVQ